MKTNLECLPCLLRQSLQTIRLCTDSESVHELAVRTIAGIIAEMDLNLTPPAIAAVVYRELENVSGVTDPYESKKKECNSVALSLIDGLRQQIAALPAEDGLDLAVRYAIAGNIIDYGAFHSFDIFEKLGECGDAEFVVDHRSRLYAAIEALDGNSKVLYLTDNCGEIVFDNLLVEYLFNKGAQITVATKGGPIINDAGVEDARTAGLQNYARVISNGTRCPGTVLDLVSDEFLEVYHGADLIVSKGQGNFESLSDADEEVYFLLTIKCAAAAHHMKELTGSDNANLNGSGELAVYHSPGRR